MKFCLPKKPKYQPKQDVDSIRIRQERKKNKEDNKWIIDMQGDKIRVEGATSLFRIYETGKRLASLSKSAPVYKMKKYQIEEEIRSKKIHWLPILTHQYVKNEEGVGFFAHTVADKPFIVIDLDQIDPDKVKDILEGSELVQKYDPLITSSLNGNTHIIFWINLSDIKKDPFCNNGNEGDVGYKHGKRYKLVVDIANKLIEEIEQAGMTGDSTQLQCDRSPVGGHMAYNPFEISAINKFFGKRKPLLLSSVFTEESQNNLDKVSVDLYRKLSPFMLEYERFLRSSQYGINEVMEWARLECGADEKSVQVFHEYRRAFSLLLKNIKTLKDHLVANWENLWFLHNKTEKMSIGVKQDTAKFFGFKIQPRLYTYVRRILLYILNLTKTRNYVPTLYKDIFALKTEDGLVNKTFFSLEFLKQNWFGLSTKKKYGFNLQELHKQLGNGNTWETMKRVIPYLVTKFGFDKGMEFFAEQLELSCANNQFTRLKEAMRFGKRIEAFPIAA